MAQPKGTVPALPEVANVLRQYCLCPYLQSGREGQCYYFVRSGARACHQCGYENGYSIGYEDGAQSMCTDVEDGGFD